jgi:hypothetical protein
MPAVWPGKTSDGVLPGLISARAEARVMHRHRGAMRYYDEGDPKTPQPVGASRKGDNALESREYEPHKVPRGDRDLHRHVHRV